MRARITALRTGLPERLRLLGPLRIRDLRLLWTGMTASLLGDGIFHVAVAWQVYELSNAPTALAVVGFGMTCPRCCCCWSAASSRTASTAAG